MLTQYLESEFADAPELLAQVMPDYPPFAKRMLRDNGTWAAHAQARQRAPRHRRRSREITPTGIARPTARARGRRDRLRHRLPGVALPRADAVAGRGGVDLHERWDGDARAYLGITVPGFPNLFCSTARTRTSSPTAASSSSRSARPATSSSACACCSTGRQRAIDCRARRARRLQRAHRRGERGAWRGARRR